MIGKIELKNIKLYCYHGCMAEETIIGSDYVVDVMVEGDFSQAAETDNLEFAIDYVTLNAIVEQEMMIPSKLLEHVGLRILKRFKNELPDIISAVVKISKLTPPINGDVEKVRVIMKI